MKTTETKDLTLADFPPMQKRQLARATAEGVELPAYPGGNPYKKCHPAPSGLIGIR